MISKVNRRGHVIYFGLFEMALPRECWNQHQNQISSMYTTRDKRGHVGVWLTLIFKVIRQGHEIYFNLFDIFDLDNARIDTKIKSVPCLQPEITKVIPVHMYDLDFQGQPSRSRDLFWFIWDPRPRECWNQHQDQVCSMYIQTDKRGHVVVCLTLIFKVNRQGHEIYSSVFDIPDLKNARIDTKIKFVSRLLQEVTI